MIMIFYYLRQYSIINMSKTLSGTSNRMLQKKAWEYYEYKSGVTEPSNATTKKILLKC